MVLRLLNIILLTGCLFLNLRAQENRPYLVIDDPIYAASIYDFSIDTCGHLLTCSWDKTARFWDFKTRKLLHTLRVPISINDGKLFSCALSPDGKIAVLSGIIGYEWENKLSVYIYDVETEKMIDRLPGIDGSSISFLTFLSKGDILIVKSGNFIYTYNVKAWKLNQRIEFKNLAYGLYVYSDKYFYVFDGNKLKLYNFSSEKELKSKKISNNKQNIICSSIAGKIAVKTEKKIYILDSETLETLYTIPNPVKETDKTIYRFFFSSDGKKLYAKGAESIYYSNYFGQTFLKCDSTNQQDSIILRLHQHNKTLYLSEILFQKSNIVKFNVEAYLEILNQGTEFSFITSDRKKCHFSLIDKNFTSTPLEYDISKFIFPSKVKDGRSFRGSQFFYYANIRFPKLYSVFSEIAFYTDDEFFPPNDIWQAGLTEDKRYFIAFLGDYTIRWYEFPLFKEILALYLKYKDDKQNDDEVEWIIWNPQGYYDCSEGAEKYLGFHLNNGRSREPSFYPAQLYYKKLYTPDLAKRILIDNEKFSDFELTNSVPTIKVLNEQLKGDSLLIDFEVTDENLSIKELDITVNEKKYNNKGVIISEKPYKNMILYSCNIPMVSGENKVKITAYNQRDIASNRLERTVKVSSDSIKPVLYLFSVGVNNSSSPYFSELIYAKKDAKDVFNTIVKGTNTLYSRIDTICLENPTRHEIESHLERIARKARAKDVFIFYFAGHGKETESNNKLDYFLITKDTDGDDYQSLHKTALSFQQICEFSTQIFAQKQLIILDACHSGTAVNIIDGGIKTRGNDDYSTVMKKLVRSTGIHLIAASLYNQNAIETRKDGHGIFTAALLDALSGKNIRLKDDIYVSALQIRDYVNDEVAKIVRENGYKEQYPTGYSVNQDFPVVLIKKK